MRTPYTNYVSLKARKLASKGPTLAQLELLRVIWELTLEKGWPPTLKELCARYNVSSTNGITEALNRLQRGGWIVRENMQSRSMKLTKEGFDVAGIVPENPYLR